MTKFAVASIYTPSIQQLAELINPNKEEYCNKHTYDLRIIKHRDIHNNGTIIDTSVNDTKIAILLKLLNTNVDWIVWIDIDAIITNQKLPLTNFIDNDYDFIVGEDWNGINVGVFFLQNTAITKQFLIDVKNYKPSEWDKVNTPWWWWQSEQASIFRCSSKIRTKIVHHSLFNGYIIGPRPDNDWRGHNIGPTDKNWQEKRWRPGDFILHLAGEFNENRIILAKKYLQMVIK